jgi:hypothetical protein
LAISVGCSEGPPAEVVWLNCRVLIDGQPAQDVKVTLQPDQPTEESFELIGVTDHSGIAEMKLSPGSQMPSVTELQLRATVDSLGDWAIRAPWSDLQKSPLSLTWDGTESVVEIQIPRKAVKSL